MLVVTVVSYISEPMVFHKNKSAVKGFEHEIELYNDKIAPNIFI